MVNDKIIIGVMNGIIEWINSRQVVFDIMVQYRGTLLNSGMDLIVNMKDIWSLAKG